ncbi:MAG TPA: GNAT family N-acetyltransferase [Phycisphaerae bacterium]|nr:GNAT family N-acetyltransferase [Phycisphaerae bacterium]
MECKIRQASPTDGPALMHIEQACRVAADFLPEEQRAGAGPRAWRGWLQCAPPFDRHPSVRRAFVAYDHAEIFGFIAASHDSMYAGYRADVAGMYVLPRYRRRGIGRALVRAAARWLVADGITRMTLTGYERAGTRGFGERLGGFVIESPSEVEGGGLITFGFTNLAEMAR